MSATVTTTERSEQRLSALRTANAKRTRWAAFKADVRAGSLDVSEPLLWPPSSMRDLPVNELLKAVPYVGPVKRGRMLARVGISVSATLGELNQRQRLGLVTLLPSQRGGGS